MQPLRLTPQQHDYLLQKGALSFCVDPRWMPIEMIEHGKHVGLAADLLKLIEVQLPVPLRLVPTDSWSQSLQLGRMRLCDLFPAMEQTPFRERHFNFTKPYISPPLVLVTKASQPFIDDLESVKHQSIGVGKEFSLTELLKRRYPGINLIELDSIQESLAQVEQEKLFGYLDNTLVINHYLKRDIYADIAITGQFDETFKLSIATRNDEPILHDIIANALDATPQEEINKLLDQWSNIRFERQIDYKILWQLGFVALIGIGTVMYWNLKLQEEMARKERIKAALKKSEAKFRMLFDEAPVLLNAFGQDRSVILWNKECEKVFGWSFEELSAVEEPAKLFYPDPNDQKRLFDSTFSQEFNVYREWHPKTKTGQTLTTMWANIALPDGEIIHIGYDITAQRRDQMELKRAKEELEALNRSLEERIRVEVERNAKQQFTIMQQRRMAQMGEMIENIAHQWRQPLAQINSAVLLIDTMLLQAKTKTPQIETKLSQIESLTAYMSQTIDRFRNYYSPDQQKREFTLRDVAEDALKLLEGSFEIHNIRTECHISSQWRCYGDMEALEQIIVVLLHNAKDALVVGAIKEPLITIDAVQTDSYYHLRIRDNATGIPADISEKIFEPYFTTKHKSQGTGIGLYMARMLAEKALDGELTLVNVPQGACFELKLPIGIHT